MLFWGEKQKYSFHRSLRNDLTHLPNDSELNYTMTQAQLLGQLGYGRWWPMTKKYVAEWTQWSKAIF